MKDIKIVMEIYMLEIINGTEKTVRKIVKN